MIYIRIGRENVEFRFEGDAEPLNNHWALWALDGKKATRYGDKCQLSTDGDLFTLAGLNEAAMRRHIAECDVMSPDSDGSTKRKETVFKGVTLGRSYNVFSAYAMLLKIGLPANVTVHSYVVARWTGSDLKKYIRRIRNHVQQNG